MANTSISNLAAGAAVSATDVVPNVQTTGVGPVKTTAAELKTYMSAAPTITGHPTIEGVTSTGATGTGNMVFSASPTLSGSVSLSGATSGAVAVSAPAVAGTTTFTLPGSNGTSGYLLQTNGSGVTTWFNWLGTANTFTAAQRITSIAPALDLRPGASDFSNIVWKSSDGVTTYANMGPEAAGSGSLWLNGAVNIYLAAGGAEKARINATNGFVINAYAGGGTTGASIDNNGALIRTPSDATLKENVQTISYGLTAIKAMHPVSFMWKDSDKYGDMRSLGFIAQEMQAIFPEAVSDNGSGSLSLDYMKLIAVLTKGIQELKAEFDAYVATHP